MASRTHDRPKKGRGAGTEYRRQATEVHGEKSIKQTRSTESQELRAEMDDLLGDIDEVLEQNAEEFLRGFVQKGGE